MHKSKIVRLLSKLNKKERVRFAEFVASPYFNKNDDLIKLLRFILKHEVDFGSDKMNKARAFQYVYPGAPPDEKKVGYGLSALFKLGEQFLASEQFRESAPQHYTNLLHKYIELDDESLFSNGMRDARKWINQNPYHDSLSYRHSFELDQIENKQFDKQRKHGLNDKLQSAIDNLDYYYLSTKLKFSCELLNRSNLLSTDFHSRLLDEIVDFLNRNPEQNVPAILIYQKILATLTESDNETHYRDLRELIERYSDVFPQHEARDLYAFAINYCIKMANLGKKSYLNELFEMYKVALAKKVLLDGPYLTPWTYKNIVSAGMTVHEFEWVENFITDYKQFVKPKFRQNAFNYNRAVLNFNLGRFGESMEALNKVEFTDVFYATDYRALLLRLYYELEEYEPLYSLLESFNVYLNRNKLISEQYLLVYSNLLRFMRKLLKLNKYEKEKAGTLLKELEETQSVAYKSWLNSKITVFT